MAQSAPTQLPAEMETVVVKNTFLEISDGSSLLSNFSRQMSEPAKKVSCWSRQISVQSQATLSDWDEWDDERTTACGRSTPKSGCASASSSSHYASHASDAHPASREAARALAEQLLVKPPTPQPQPCPGGSPAGLSANTVTMRDVPAEYTKQEIIGELQDAGFKYERDYDFLYVPKVVGGNTTSCFVNFTSAPVMNAFCAAFHGRKMRQSQGTGTVRVDLTTPDDLRLLGGGQALAPSYSPSAAAPQNQVIQPAPATAPRPVQISLQGVVPPAPPSQAWGQLGAQPGAPPPTTVLPGGRLGQQPTAHAVVFCPQCGTKGEGKFNFCSQCGFCVERFRQATAQVMWQ